MKKKIVRVLLTIAVFGLLLAGCGSKKADVSQTEEAEETEAATEIEAEEVTETAAEENTELAEEPKIQKETERAETEPVDAADQEVQEEPVSAAPDESIEQVEEPVVENNVPEPPALSVYDTGNGTLNQLCDTIVYSIVNDAMSEREKARAVYDWVENNIRYSGTTPITDWVTGGIATLNSRKGNCYGFYSVSAALLTRLGIENMLIHEEDDSHFWNLVKVDGAWYHFDTTKGWGTERFLWTDAQMDAYEYDNGSYGVIRYNWDHSKYPATP